MMDDADSEMLSTTSALLGDLRSLQVAVYHPYDRDGEELTLQLKRFGCKVNSCWPARPELPEKTDIVFLTVLPNKILPEWAVNRDVEGPTIIAVVTYENPTIIDAVLKLNVESVVTSPVRSFGLLATLVVARQIHQRRILLYKKNKRLEAKLAGVRVVTEAKIILMNLRRISEKDAYRLIREQAMAKRVTIEHVAETIVEAHKILPLNSA